MDKKPKPNLYVLISKFLLVRLFTQPERIY